MDSLQHLPGGILYKLRCCNMPFNMNTFHKIWGVITPAEAKAKIEEQVKEYGVKEPKNLEEQAISLVGKDIYEILVKGTPREVGETCDRAAAGDH